MKTQIFVEGNELDLTEDIACELSYVIDDVKDFGSKNTSYSKTIVIQGTQKNNKIFNHISELGRFIPIESVNIGAPNVNENYIASNGSNCLILVDNIQIFKGKLRVLEVVKYEHHIEYQCAVFGELGGFYYELSKGSSIDQDGNSTISTGSRLLEHLNWGDLNHTWNLSTIQSSWNNRITNPGVGYFYPLIDYGKVAETSARNHFNEQALRPAIYVREYIQRIFALSGYTYECPFFDTDFFKRLIVPNNDDRLKSYKTQLMQLGTYYSLSSSSPSATYPVLWYSGTFNDFASIGSGQYQYTGATTLYSPVVTFIAHGVLNFLSSGYVTTKLYLNGSVYTYLKTYTQSNINGGNITMNDISNVTLPILSTNDILEIRFEVSNPSNSVNNYSFDTSELYFNTSVAKLVPATWLDVLTMQYAVPQNIKITDFFTSLLKMFNLYVIEDKLVPKKLIITPYIDFYVNQSVDWTNKLDRSSEIRITPMGELNARVFNFKYKDDDAYWNKTYKQKYNEGYMDFSYDTEYEYAKDKEDLEVIFSSTINYAPTGQDKIIPALYKEGNFADESICASNIRILQTKMLTVSPWDLKKSTGGNIQTNITQFPYSGMWEDPLVPDNGTYFQSLGWASPSELYYNITGSTINYGLFNSFWSQYFAEITNPNSTILVASFYLTSMDIRTLEFSKSIIIDGTLWRINKIENYDPLTSRPTKVELLKVIDTIY